MQFTNLLHKLEKPVSIAPLSMFRVLFGGVMLASIIRFIAKGWVYDLYIAPKYFFTFYGFEWVKPLGATGMYMLFFIMALSAAAIMLGWKYRAATILFFLSFTYVELIDKTNYLNHYYFVSIVSLLLIFVPAHRYFSIDVATGSVQKLTTVPAWTVGIFKLQLGIVYFYAGLAKLNSDWLMEAMPLRIWLPANAHYPIIGWLFDYVWVAYFFSWFGAVYDLTIPFLLLNKTTRPWAYAAVLAFHLMTYWLFQIGMFPYIMILSTLIFFPATFHQGLISRISGAVSFLYKPKAQPVQASANSTGATAKPFVYTFLAIHFAVQLFVPFRFALYPDNLFWTEQGFRFSWRVMLMEKAGLVTFYVKDPASGREGEADHNMYLTPNQEKMMSTQPDMILQFAHFLEEQYKKEGIKDPQVRAECYVTVNGRGSRLYLDPTIDLTQQKESFRHKAWILPFGQE